MKNLDILQNKKIQEFMDNTLKDHSTATKNEINFSSCGKYFSPTNQFLAHLTFF